MQTVTILTKYQDSFNRLTELEEQTGLSPESGLMGLLNELTNRLSSELETIAIKSEEKTEIIQRNSFISLIGIGLISILISSIATYVTASKLTKPIKRLSQTMGRFVLNEESIPEDLEHFGSTEEIKTLYNSFEALRIKLKSQFEEINQKSELSRTQNIELTKLNEDLDRFIYGAAHDLKSPLSSLLGLISVAEVDLVTPGKEHYFKMMKGSVNKLESFIKDITDYARNKRQNLTVSKIVLENIIRSILDDLVFLPNYNNIDRQLEIKGEVFYTDKTRLEIVVVGRQQCTTIGI